MVLISFDAVSWELPNFPSFTDVASPRLRIQNQQQKLLLNIMKARLSVESIWVLTLPLS